jgi:hypothetical protein
MSGDFLKSDVATVANIAGPDKRASLIKMHISKQLSRLPSSLVPGITNWCCGPSFETATSWPPQDEVYLLIHNNLMLRSERRERLEAWATSDSPNLS